MSRNLSVFAVAAMVAFSAVEGTIPSGAMPGNASWQQSQAVPE